MIRNIRSSNRLFVIFMTISTNLMFNIVVSLKRKTQLRFRGETNQFYLIIGIMIL